MKPSSLIIILALLVQLSGRVGGQSTDLSNANILVIGNRIVQFTPSTSEIHVIETPLDSISGYPRGGFDNRSQSPQNSYMVTWETFPNYFENGLWLFSLNEPYELVQFPVELHVDYHYVNAQWPLGERFALVRAGIVTGGDPEYPNPIWMLDTNVWLVDTMERTIQPWYWNCDTLIFRDNSQDFAVQCTENLPPFAVETHFLTTDGVAMTVDRPYRTLYTRTTRYEPGWVFTPEMDRVAVVNRHTDAPLRDEVLIYGLDGSAKWLATFDRQTQPVSNLFWSPRGRYLGISTGCFGLTISDCFQIRDVQTGAVIWDASRLGETLYGSRHLAVTSIYWLDGENEFLLLGHLVNEDRGSYIWHLSLDQSQPLARWEIPSSLFYIISVVQ